MERMEDLPAPDLPISKTLRCLWRLLLRSMVLMLKACESVSESRRCGRVGTLYMRAIWEHQKEVMVRQRWRVGCRGLVFDLDLGKV